MTQLTIPRGPEDFTPEWLTQALRSRCSATDYAVDSFRVETLDTVKGLGSEIARLRLAYVDESEDLPRSLIAKFPAAHPETRAMYARIRSHQREIGFYEEVAGEVPLRTPRCYYTAADSETGDFLLLLEDLFPARIGDQAAGCSQEDAKLAVEGLARLHARCWESSRLYEYEWLPAWDAFADHYQESYCQCWNLFMERYHDLVPAGIAEVAELVGRRVARIKHRSAEPPQTLVHGDYRLDNLFFGDSESDLALTVIDWGESVRGRGMYDVAYFLTGSMGTEQRRGQEMTLLRRYPTRCSGRAGSATMTSTSACATTGWRCWTL